MNIGLVKFSECGTSERIELAGKVLTGQASICILTTRDCFGLSNHDPGYEVVDPHERFMENKQQNPMLDRFDTGRFLDFDGDEKEYYTTEYNWYPDAIRGPTLLDHRKLSDWIFENKRTVKPGLYELVASKEFAAEIVTGGSPDHNENPSFLDRWPRFKRAGVFVYVGEEVWELFTLIEMHGKDSAFEEKGNVYCEAYPPSSLQLAFKLEAVKPRADNQPTKTNLIKSLMLRYLDSTDGQGDFPGCIDFLLQNGVEQDADGSHFVWQSIGAGYQKNSKKTMQNLFSSRKKEWNEQ